MMLKRTLVLGAVLVVGIVALACASGAMDGQASGAQNADYTAEGVAPLFEVDPFWPKPLPNHWIMGATIGVDVDSRDHVWIVQRNTDNQFALNTELGADGGISDCCNRAPSVLEFDPDGNLVSAWGGPGTETGDYFWPGSNHGITVDHMDNVWIGGNGATDAGMDRHILKFSRDGTFLAQYGAPGPADGADSNSMDDFGMVAKIFVDGENNEAYIADGYRNQRVAVLDASTGAMKRYWGAYGNQPDGTRPPRYEPGETPPQQFRTPVHCADMSHDGLLYVCDRPSNRISIFQGSDGTFISEHIIAPQTLNQGSTWDIGFSPDPDQTWIYLADGQNMKVYVIRRTTMEVVYSFGDGGRAPGLWFAVHSIAVDSEGNIYTTETYEGKRLQKFTFMGMGEASGDMGPAWPADRRRSP